MRITEKTGDAVAIAAGLPIPALAHGVNCKGRMGKGFALQVRQGWPSMYERYQHMCQVGLLAPGGFMAWQSPRGGWLWNLASQDSVGASARIEWVEQSVRSMAEHAQSMGIDQVASVRIGCGIGGLEWDEVREVLQGIDSELELIVCQLENPQDTGRSIPVTAQ